MAEKIIKDLFKEAGIENPVQLDYCPVKLKEKNRVNILALGDVGTAVLVGLRIMGGDVISSIGIYDLNSNNLARLEMEINQIRIPFECKSDSMPYIEVISEDKLFDCDMLIFCASKGVPEIGTEGDVRMAQLSANRKIISNCGKMAKEACFKGFIAVVSDPVDPLCKALLEASELKPSQIQGYGLGVMNARALYYAEKNPSFASYISEGRAYGPHGSDLVIANSVINYDDKISEELTELTVNCNVRVRELGYKPYIAPALSSAAIPIIMTLRGQWHYSSLYFGNGINGAFLGIRNIMNGDGAEFENIAIDEKLFRRIRESYINLCIL